MKLADVLSTETIDLGDHVFSCRDEAFMHMAKMLYHSGSITSIEAYLELLAQREALGSTYMGDDLAVPHGKGLAVKHNAAALCRCKPFKYESCGESGEVRIIMMLAITDQDDNANYIKILSSLARLLMNENFRHAINCASDAQTILDVGEGILQENKK